MATPSILNFEQLLQPPSSDASDEAREEMRRELRRVRDTIRAAEKARLTYELHGPAFPGEPVPEAPDWDQLLNRSLEVLSSTWKDLWITAWLIEALMRKYGYAGLRDGFRLAKELVKNFWETIEPRPDEEEGVLHTVRMLENLNGPVLIDPILALPITWEDGDLPALTSGTFNDYSEGDRDRLAAATPVDFFQDLVDDIGAAQEEFAGLCQILDEKCGRDESGLSLAPASSEIRAAFEETRARVMSLCRDRLPHADTESDADAVDPSSAGGSAEQDAGGTVASLGSLGNLNRREDAFRVLEQVADFFRRTEPHSPVSYCVQQAVRWGRMPLNELLTELISDDNVRKDMFRWTGIRNPEEDQE